jgi:hypothetical protein
MQSSLWTQSESDMNTLAMKEQELASLSQNNINTALNTLLGLFYAQCGILGKYAQNFDLASYGQAKRCQKQAKRRAFAGGAPS